MRLGEIVRLVFAPPAKPIIEAGDQLQSCAAADYDYAVPSLGTGAGT